MSLYLLLSVAYVFLGCEDPKSSCNYIALSVFLSVSLSLSLSLSVAFVSGELGSVFISLSNLCAGDVKI